MGIRRLLALFLLAVPVLAEEQFYYVDPVNGVDAPSGGTQGAPWRTIRYAASQPLATLARINLLPGVYSEASGERFPIDLPPYVNVHGVAPGGARLEVPLSATLPTRSVLFRTSTTGGGNTFSDIDVRADHALLEVVVGGGSPYFDLARLDVEAPVAVQLTVAGGAAPYFTVYGSRFACVDGAVLVDVDGTGPSTTLDLILYATELSAGPGAAAVAVTASGAKATVRVESRFTIHHGADAGLALAPSEGAMIDVEVARALFHGLGAGGVVETLGGPGPRPTLAIENSIFWANEGQSDLPDHSAASYSITSCMFEDPLLAARPDSVPGPPWLVDPEGGDWHSLPGGPARDAGTVTGSFGYYDFEGDPATVLFGGDGIPDLGPDEVYDRYLWLHRPLALNRPSRLRVLGPAGELAAVWVGAVSYYPGFGAGLQLQQPYSDVPVLLGLLPPSGLLEATVTLTAGPELAGLPYMIQAGYLDPLSFTVRWSANARKGWVRI
jgi:hypothetical protein